MAERDHASVSKINAEVKRVPHQAMSASGTRVRWSKRFGPPEPSAIADTCRPVRRSRRYSINFSVSSPNAAQRRVRDASFNYTLNKRFGL